LRGCLGGAAAGGEGGRGEDQEGDGAEHSVGLSRCGPGAQWSSAGSSMPRLTLLAARLTQRAPRSYAKGATALGGKVEG
jgi:hypothetical protein